jgi:hypothetical protein
VALSDVSIANSALSKIGAGSIIALTDDTPAGYAVNARYAAIRDAELTRHVWRFSVKRAALSALSSTPSFGYAYEYQLPTDCLRLIVAGQSSPGLDVSEFRSAADNLDYTIEGRKILTDYPAPLYIRYVYRATDPTQFDNAFAEAFASRLAYELSTALSDSTSRKEAAWADYQAALRDAVRANALQQPAQYLADDSWLASRQ